MGTSFESDFFTYEIPVPLLSHYTEEFVRSNDLRLLLEIATRSYLRMYTDPKTGFLHFICKQRGSQCFDLQAHPHHSNNSYYFPTDHKKQCHEWGCEQKEEAFRYLQIYNLMKLKKQAIEDFMVENDLMRDSPSAILSQLSPQSDQYFFEKYIMGHLELKRKLRKRFDNIVNIDIKKIGKEAKGGQNTPPATSKAIKNYKTNRKTLKASPLPKSKAIKRNTKRNFSNKENEYEQLSEDSNSCISHIEKSKDKEIMHVQAQPLAKSQMFFSSDSEQVLPQLRVLSQQADLFWSSSSQQSRRSVCEKEPPIDIFNNRQDYFKSLRNSTLRKSLEKDSLTAFSFICDFQKEEL